MKRFPKKSFGWGRKEEEEEKEPLGILRSAMLRNMRAMEEEENLSSCSPEDKKAKVLSTLFFYTFSQNAFHLFRGRGGVVNKSLVYFLFVLDFASLPYFFEGKTVHFLPKRDNNPFHLPLPPSPPNLSSSRVMGFMTFLHFGGRTEGGREEAWEGGSLHCGLFPGKRKTFLHFIRPFIPPPLIMISSSLTHQH